MDGQQLLATHLGKSKGCAAALSHNRNIGRLFRQKSFGQCHYYVLTMSVNGASMIFSLACWKIQGLCGDIKLQSNYQPTF